MRRSTLAILFCLLTSAFVVSPGAGTLASTAIPPGDQMWPACDGSQTTFCVVSLSIDGVDQIGGSNWRLNASVLDSDNGVVSFNWAVESWTGSQWSVPSDTALTVDFVLNSGSIKPMFTQAIAANMSLVPGGSSGSGYTITVEGSPVMIEWKTQSGGCSIGNCGGPTTSADTEQPTFSGNTQNMATWSAEERGMFGGMWYATDAQYQGLPQFSTFPSPNWNLELGNPHLAKDGSTPVVGTYGAYVPKGLLDAVNATDQEAAAAGLQVTRTDGSAVTTVGAAVMATGDGGVYLRIPQVSYSKPRLTFKGTRGKKVVLKPDQPRAVTAQPLDGGAVVRFHAPYFTGGSHVTGYDVRCANGGPVLTASTTAAVAVEFEGLSNGSPWQCSVRARNAAKTGNYSYVVYVTPQSGLDPIPPGAPQSIKTVQRASVLISWALPASTGGSPITGYRVDVCRAGKSCPGHALVSKTTSGGRSVSVHLPANRYTVVVRAQNAVGFGDAARTSLKVT